MSIKRALTLLFATSTETLPTKIVRAFRCSGVSSCGTYFFCDGAFAFRFELVPFRRDSCIRDEGSTSSSEIDEEGPASESASGDLEGGLGGDFDTKACGGSASCSGMAFVFLDFFSFLSDFLGLGSKSYRGK